MTVQGYGNQTERKEKKEKERNRKNHRKKNGRNIREKKYKWIGYETENGNEGERKD